MQSHKQQKHTIGLRKYLDLRLHCLCLLKFGIEQWQLWHKIKIVSFNKLSTKKTTLPPTWHHISFQINLGHKKPNPLAQLFSWLHINKRASGFMASSEKNSLFVTSGSSWWDGDRSLNEVTETNIPHTLPPGNLGHHLAPLPTWYIILGMWLNLTEPQFCKIGIITLQLPSSPPVVSL